MAPQYGTNTWHVYTFIAERPIQSVKAKIPALTPRTSQQDPRAALFRINQILRGWSNYFRYAVRKHTLHPPGPLCLTPDCPVAADQTLLEWEDFTATLPHP